MGLPQTLPIFTSDEYLAFERNSADRHEFLEGFVYAMAGASLEHSTISANLTVRIGMQLIGQPCRMLSPNMKVQTGSNGLYACPDVAVVCGEPRFYDERRDILTHPKVIIEILSPSAANYESGAKSMLYRTQIETLTDYLIVWQDRPRIEHFVKEPDGNWTS
jgi:Uma2 family endonuclease